MLSANSMPKDRAGLHVRNGLRAVGSGALRVYLAGCAGFAGMTGSDHPEMMATPVLYKDQRLDFMRHTPAQAHTTEVPVYYATTRAPAQPRDAKHYTNAPGQELRLGVAHIR